MTATAKLPIDGALPDLGGATRWLNSEPLDPAELHGRGVLEDRDYLVLCERLRHCAEDRAACARPKIVAGGA